MEKSKQIQIGLLALCAILLGLNLAGVFSSSDKGESDAVKNAEKNVGIASSNAVGTAPAAAPAPNSVNPSMTPAPNPAAKAAAPEVPSGPTTSMNFEETVFDFGTVDEGEKVSHKYKFTNTGSEPLIIKDAKGSCGCTVPSWPKDPILPGESSEMLVEFNSKGKPGSQSKRVTITANTNPPQTYITIKGEVEKVAPAQ